MTAAVRPWLATQAVEKPPRSALEPRTGPPAWGGNPATLTEALRADGCGSGCPVCTDTAPPELSDLPWPAFRWTPDLEERQ